MDMASDVQRVLKAAEMKGLDRNEGNDAVCLRGIACVLWLCLAFNSWQTMLRTENETA
jgi:hypothetical protein